jgi:hypothetical protein
MTEERPLYEQLQQHVDEENRRASAGELPCESCQRIFKTESILTTGSKNAPCTLCGNDEFAVVEVETRDLGEGAIARCTNCSHMRSFIRDPREQGPPSRE